MRAVKTGLIGAGFVGPLHVEAVRRLGYVEVVGVAASTLESAKNRAGSLGVHRAYGSYEDLLNDPDIEAVHICTPNYLHSPVVLAAIERRKHVICDKPLGLTAREAKQMLDAANEMGVVNAVTFNYRFNPLVQQARVTTAKGELGKIRFVHGRYLQDWLMYETDFSWRLEPEKSGDSCAVADIGSHWCDTAMFITSHRIVRVLANLKTTIPIRRRPSGSREAFAAGDSGPTEDYKVTTDDLGVVLVEFEGGAQGTFSVGQVTAGHKNDFRIEICGSKASLEWQQERPNEMWIGHRDQPSLAVVRDPALLDESVRSYAKLPAGHNEGWADAFRNLMSDIYSFISEGGDPIADQAKIRYPTFQDGYVANCIVDAIVESSRKGSVWTTIEY